MTTLKVKNLTRGWRDSWSLQQTEEQLSIHCIKNLQLTNNNKNKSQSVMVGVEALKKKMKNFANMSKMDQSLRVSGGGRRWAWEWGLRKKWNFLPICPKWNKVTEHGRGQGDEGKMKCFAKCPKWIKDTEIGRGGRACGKNETFCQQVQIASKSQSTGIGRGKMKQHILPIYPI